MLEETLNEAAAAAHVQVIERAVGQALLPFNNEQTEAILVAFALVRVARSMLRLYPPAIQLKIVPLVVAYLQGQTAPPGADSPLWMP